MLANSNAIWTNWLIIITFKNDQLHLISFKNNSIRWFDFKVWTWNRLETPCDNNSSSNNNNDNNNNNSNNNKQKQFFMKAGLIFGTAVKYLRVFSTLHPPFSLSLLFHAHNINAIWHNYISLEKGKREGTKISKRLFSCHNNMPPWEGSGWDYYPLDEGGAGDIKIYLNMANIHKQKSCKSLGTAEVLKVICCLHSEVK